jgi:hypothetical protein
MDDDTQSSELTDIKRQVDDLIQQNGGFWLFGKQESEEGPTVGRAFSESVSSEKSVIEAYERLVVSIKNYYTKYAKHIDNLEKLGSRAGFDSLGYIFKHILVKDHIKPYEVVDSSIPLFLKNYLVSDTSSPKSLMTNHIYQQVLYKLRNNFSPNEQRLIKDIQPYIKSKDRVQLVIRTSDDKLYSREVEHKRLNLNLSSVRAILKEIIDNTKSSIGFKDDGIFEPGKKPIEFKPEELAEKGKSGKNIGQLYGIDFRKTKKSSGKHGKKSSSTVIPKIMSSIADITFSDSSKKSGSRKGNSRKSIKSRKYTTGAHVNSVKSVKRSRKSANQNVSSTIKFSVNDVEKIPKIEDKIIDLRFDKSIGKLFEPVPNIADIKKDLFILDKSKFEERDIKKSEPKSSLYSRFKKDADRKVPDAIPVSPSPDVVNINDDKLQSPALANIVGKAGEEKATPVNLQQSQKYERKKRCKEIDNESECQANTECIYENNKCEFKGKVNRGPNKQGQKRDNRARFRRRNNRGGLD